MRLLRDRKSRRREAIADFYVGGRASTNKHGPLKPEGDKKFDAFGRDRCRGRWRVPCTSAGHHDHATRTKKYGVAAKAARHRDGSGGSVSELRRGREARVRVV